MATVNISPPQVYMPPGSTGQPNIMEGFPLGPILDGAILIFSSGTPAAGFFNLGGTFVAGDTITYAVNGVGGSSPITVSSLSGAVQALLADINAHSGTNLVNAAVEITPQGFIVLMEANTPGTAGNSITISISTTSAAGTVVASNTTLLGGSATTASGLSPASSNVSGGIAGVAIQNSAQNYGGSPQIVPALNAVFGYSQVGTPLVPGDAFLTKYAQLLAPAQLEINLAVTNGWLSGGTYQAAVGSAVGIGIDPTTGFYVVDTSLSNKVGLIAAPLIGPSAGSVGDLAHRVLVSIYPTALAL